VSLKATPIFEPGAAFVMPGAILDAKQHGAIFGGFFQPLAEIGDALMGHAGEAFGILAWHAIGRDRGQLGIAHPLDIPPPLLRFRNIGFRNGTGG
jgi:hypothetical protein